MMISINEIFDKVYLINLENDTDKYQIMKSKLDKFNIKFELFKAIDGNKLKNCKLLRFGNKGAVGCKMSHMKIIENAKYNNYSKILILEDDLYFWKNFNERFDSLYKNLINIDKNWKLIYFGASNRTGKRHINFIQSNQSVYKIGSKFITGAYAIGYDKSLYDTILKSKNDNRPYDDIIGNDIQENNYIFSPYLIYPNIKKASSTVDNNSQNQIFYNKLNYLDKNNYI
jgi:GR25 family glycosyltransferase involved in LPS biosynthesis